MDLLNSLQYDYDCELIDICKNNGSTYNLCYKGSSALNSGRCTPSQKQVIIQQNLLVERQERYERKRSKSAYIEILLAFLLGIVGTLIAIWLSSIIGL